MGGCGGDCGCADGGCSNGSGCADGGCGGSGCNLPSGGDDAGGNTIYDGPAAGAPEVIPSETRSHTAAPYQLVSNAAPTGAGVASFKKGVAAYRSHGLTEALSHFEMAVTDEPENALYHYYLALTFQELYGADAGQDVLQQAVELERRDPIKNWGKRMERVQGSSRLWIEKARRQAGLTR